MTFTNFNDLSSLNNQVITTNSMFQKKLLEFKNYSNIDTTISFEYSIAVSKNSVVVEYVNENERNLIETIRSFNKT